MKDIYALEQENGALTEQAKQLEAENHKLTAAWRVLLTENNRLNLVLAEIYKVMRDPEERSNHE